MITLSDGTYHKIKQKIKDEIKKTYDVKLKLQNSIVGRDYKN